MSDKAAVREGKQPLAKRVISIAVSVVLYAFIAISVLAVIIVLVGKRDRDGTVNAFGYQMRTVLTGSMEKNDRVDVSGYDIGSIPVNSMVFIEMVPDDPAEAARWYGELEVGDVLTFRYFFTNQETITHRVIEKEPVEGGYRISLRGDNIKGEYGDMVQVIDTTKATSSTNYIIGRVTHVSPLLGRFITTIRSPLGMVFIIILPCFIIIALEALRIVRVVGEDKRRKLGEERQRQNDRIAELEKRIAELSETKNGSSGDGESA